MFHEPFANRILNDISDLFLDLSLVSTNMIIEILLPSTAHAVLRKKIPRMLLKSVHQPQDVRSISPAAEYQVAKIRHENKRENVTVLVGRLPEKDFNTLFD
ncbi:MAG: hypothetical protein HW407_2182 [Bacteroidetes bacterium]|nr:hypothetical protein [Bacteroidota bacterium]